MPRKKKEVIYASPELEKTLVENLVQLQKINTDLATRFNSLSRQISALLEIFEKAAQNFVHTPENKVSEKDKEFLDKIDKLLEQNKTIAKGLVIMEENIRNKSGENPKAPTMERKERAGIEDAISSPKPLPRF
ncbi:MAG: hypothetical protein WCK90_03915 [archaeon]